MDTLNDKLVEAGITELEYNNPFMSCVREALFTGEIDLQSAVTIAELTDNSIF